MPWTRSASPSRPTDTRAIGADVPTDGQHGRVRYRVETSDELADPDRHIDALRTFFSRPGGVPPPPIPRGGRSLLILPTLP